jgi:hypothetical protein
METFEYEPLPRGDDGQWIRLIELHRGQGSDKIECSIQHVNLADNPQYEAISYCWGDPTIRSTISCSDGRHVTVTANLYAALSAIRFKDESRPLWADALCINQSDVDERNAQVAIMRSIYDKAQRVLVWLGEETDTSDRGLDFMERLVKACPQDIVLELQKTVLHHDPIELLKRVNVSLNEKDVRAFLSILQRPWFRRVWVVQEVAMSKNSLLLCGARTFYWPDLFSTIRFILATKYTAGVDISFLDYPNFIDKARRDVVAGSETRLLTALFRHRRFLATDVRDKVFGLSGILHGLTILPDYRRSVGRVYQSVAASIIAQDRNLELLSIPKVSPQSNMNPNDTIPGLPSWVPDWSAGDMCLPFPLRGDFIGPPAKPSFQAAGTSVWSPPTKVAEDESVLKVSGHTIDDIELCGLPIILPNEISPQKNSLSTVIKRRCFELDVDLSWKKLCHFDSGKKYITGEDMSDAFLYTIVAGFMPEGYEATRQQFRLWEDFVSVDMLAHKYLRGFGWFYFAYVAASVMIKQFQAMVRAILGFRVDVPKALRGSFLQARSWAGTNRLFFTTTKGFIGLGPCMAQKGDRIALIEGCKVPLALRPKGTTGWELVGECYIHGVMNGEAFQPDNCGPLKLC